MIEIELPKATDIDYSNVDEVEGYSLYLTKRYERAGGFTLPRRATLEIKAIEVELRVWCDKVKEMLVDAPLRDIPTLISSFDLPYRIVHCQAPSREFMRKVRLNAVQRWTKGDKSISSTAIAKILWDEIYSPEFKTLENKYGLYYFGLINDWVKELQRRGTFSGITPAETYMRLHLLMTENLFATYGSKGAAHDKRQWAASHQIKELATLDTPTLREYMAFACAAATNVCGFSLEEQTAEYIRLLTELTRREDLNPYLHAALDLAMKQERYAV